MLLAHEEPKAQKTDVTGSTVLKAG
jgi:hypothetical protein